MKETLKKYRAFPIGLAFTFILVKVSAAVDLIRVDQTEGFMNGLIFLFYTVFISLAIHNYLKKGGSILRLGAGGLVIISLIFTIGNYTNHIKDNPLVILLLLSFWLLLFYLILPGFFKKYRYLILGSYALASAYFISVRLFTPTFEQYEDSYKMLALGLFLVPVPVLVLLWGYEQWKWFKTLKAEKASAELALLRSQVNPHFFFNTLNNLYSLAVQKSEEAPDVILKLSDMMRYTIYEGKSERVKLSQEVEYLQKYIELHRIRYNREVDIRFEYPEDSDTEVAPLLFIILLENAFKHGAESLRDHAYIHIRLTESAGKISFSITNNFEELPSSGMEGIGLKNLKKRLELLYPEKHELRITKENGIYEAELHLEVV